MAKHWEEEGFCRELVLAGQTGGAHEIQHCHTRDTGEPAPALLLLTLL